MAEESAVASHQAHTSNQSNVHSAGGNVLTHKIGPLPVWGYFAIGLAAFLIIRYLKHRGSAASTIPGQTGGTQGASSVFGTQGFSVDSNGNIIDNATGAIVGSSGTGGTSTSTSGEAWFNSAFQALQNLGYDNGTINSALQAYAQGNKLTPSQYGIVEAAIKLVGAPPSGVGTPVEGAGAPAGANTPTTSTSTPPTSALPASGPPNLPASLISAMSANNEHLVDTVYDPAYNSWLYLTNKGGVYDLNTQGGQGAGFFGSLFSLPPDVFTGTGRQAQKLVVTKNGSYTVFDTVGEGYTFGPPGSGADYAISSKGG